ncbi:hypothetical protein Agub_g6679 [Astrephomene gubernaculifera]|uniref:Uncharacterized protein n=1 Tax=Astrephomene gubernaculifera TaxID=47775 RepID=A0AAD3HLW4_9CHLO|nr:hypothetical protein Agub_g6679 [Astrephomene gubernaculifera]
MWCKLAHPQHAGVQTTLATAMRALNFIQRGLTLPAATPCPPSNAIYNPSPPSLASTASCSPRCLPPAPTPLHHSSSPYLLHHHRRLSLCSAAFTSHSGSTAIPSATAAASTCAPVAPASAATASAVTPLRFRSGRRRMTALERAAAAAHDALAEAHAAAAAAAAAAAPAKGAASTVKGAAASRGATVAAVGAAPGVTPRQKDFGTRPRAASVAAAAASRTAAAGPLAMTEGGFGDGAEEEQEREEGEEEMGQEERQAVERRRRFVGQLQGVPHVVSAAEHLGSARKRAAKVAPSAGIKNAAEKERNRAARRLDTLMQALAVPLGRYVAAFPQPDRLHPFERELLALTVGEAAYCGALQRVERLRKAVQEVGKGAASRAAQAPNKAAATAASEEGVAALEAVFSAGARHVDALKEVAKQLRSLPSLDPSLPTLALVGAPNVGKSSLVNILSSGTPEVCNYPFTTRSIKMGHFYLDAQKHQVTDTPGLLRRPDAARNRMERLTLAALGCLDAAVVVFVADLTGECGTGVADQWAIRRELQSRFPGRPWIDVLSKSDMLEDVFAAADELIRKRQATGSDERPTGQWPMQPSLASADRQQQQTVTTEAMRSSGSSKPQEEEEVKGEGVKEGPRQEHRKEQDEEEEVESAVEVAARLTHAVRISSLTHDGIPQLQLAIIRTLRARQAAQQQQMLQQQQQAAQARALAQQQLGQQGEQRQGLPVVTFFSP